MKQYFVTGTDTGVGKTLASAVLMQMLKAKYWKPIQSGIQNEEQDAMTIQRLTHLPESDFFPSSYSLQASLSPDQAAKLENITIDLMQCALPQTEKNLIVEGAGGVMVPINDNECMLDLMQTLKLPIIIVARGTLGTINHTLLTIEALRRRQLFIYGVIFNGELNQDNQRAIEYWGQVKTLLHIPKFSLLNQETFQSWINNMGENKNDIILA